MATQAVNDLLGKVTQVIDPENFVMQIGTAQQLAEFLQFETTLEEYCSYGKDSRMVDPEKLVLGNMALVDTGQNGAWRRGQITRLDLDKGHADVFFIDYGTTVLVDIDKLCLDFPDSFRYDVAAQALKCCLAGIKPIAKSWPSRAIKSFQSMTEGEVFHTVVHCNRNGTFVVSLYTQDIGRSLASHMLDEELGMPSDDEVFEMFSDVKDNYCKVQSTYNSEDNNEWYYDNEDGTEEEYTEETRGSEDGDFAGGSEDSNFSGAPVTSCLNVGPGSGSAVSPTKADYSSSDREPVFNNVDIVQSSSTISSVNMNYNGSGLDKSSDISGGVGSALTLNEHNMVSGTASRSEQITEPNGEYSDSDGLPTKSPAKIIPGFDFGQIQRTKNTSTGKLRDKILKEEVSKLKEESSKIKEEMAEQSNMAKLAGYGGLEDHEDVHDPVSGDHAGSLPQWDQVVGSRSEELKTNDNNKKSGPVLEKESRSENDVRNRKRHGSGNSGKIMQTDDTPSDILKSKSLTDTQRNSPTSFNHSTRLYKQSRGSPVDFRSKKDIKRRSPVELSSENDFKVNSSQNSPRRRKSPHDTHMSGKDSPVDIQGNPNRSSTPNYIDLRVEKREIITKHRKKIPLVTEIGDSIKLFDVHSSLTKIFRESETDTEEVTRDKLEKLFSTDMYMYLKKEQLCEIITLILNRAIRYYGEIHDAMLAIIETLEGSEDFLECLLKGLKKMQDAYLKSHTTRSLFHTQCSKIIAHICNMSMHWGERASVIQEHVMSIAEKWIFFNLKGTQSGESVDRLQVIYLQCFEVLWQIASTSLLQVYPDLQVKLKDQCKEKLFQKNISRNVKEKLLDLYISCFCTSSDPTIEKLEQIESGCQTEKSTRDAHCQTDTYQTFQDDLTNSIPDNKTMDLIKSLAESVSVPEWPTPDLTRNIPHKRDRTLMTPDSFNSSAMTSYSKDSSAYFTPEEPSWLSDFPPIQSPGDCNLLVTSSSARESHSIQNTPVAPPPGFTTYPSWSQCVAAKSSPNENRQKSPKKSPENISIQKEQSYPVKSYSASRALLHDKPRADKSKAVKSKSVSGANLNSKAENKGGKSSSETTLQGLMKEMFQNYNVPQSEGSVTTSDSESYRLKANSTPDHWDDSFSSDQENISGVKNEKRTSSQNTQIANAVQSDSSKDVKVEKQEQTDWWSVEDAGNNTMMGSVGDMVNNTESPGLAERKELSLNLDKNDNVVEGVEAKNDQKVDYSLLIDEYDDFEWTSDSDDDEFCVIVPDNQNVANEQPADVKESKPKTAYAKPKAPSWRPGLRKCTICGDATHLIYNCPDKNTNGKGFFL